MKKKNYMKIRSEKEKRSKNDERKVNIGFIIDFIIY